MGNQAYEHQVTDYNKKFISLDENANVTAWTMLSLYKKLSCRREAVRCFVFVCSQLQVSTYLQRSFLLPVTAASDLLVHKIL